MCVVKSPYVDSFEINLDKFWCSQEVYYNYKATKTGTGNRSIVMWQIKLDIRKCHYDVNLQ